MKRIITFLFVVCLLLPAYLFSDNLFPITCSATITSFPYSESFESGWGNWANQGSTIWQRYSSYTPSSGTGPSSAYDGTFYLFTESSYPNYPNKNAILEGPCFDFTQTGAAHIKFHYHMYGTSTGTLKLQINTSVDTSWTTLWEKTGNQGNQWYQDSVDLSIYTGRIVKLRFFGITGTSYTSDMAIDKLSINTTALNNSGASCDTNLIATFPYVESFESGWGKWKEKVSMNIWQRRSGSTPSSPTGPPSAQNGAYYIFTEASGNTPYKNAVVEGPCFDLFGQDAANFRFHYNMYGADIGSLRLEISTDQGGSWIAVWSKSGNVSDDDWYAVNVDLTSYVGQIIKLRFFAVTGLSYLGDMAIDNLQLTVGTGQISGTLAGYVGFPNINSCSTGFYACCDFDNLVTDPIENVGFDIRDLQTSNIVASPISNLLGNYGANINDGLISITPIINDTINKNGINTLDMVRLSRHVDDIEYLECPFQRITADVDGDGDIDTNDKNTLNSYLLGVISTLPVPDWRLIPKAYYHPSETHPDRRFTTDFWNKALEDANGDEFPFKAKLRVAGDSYNYTGSEKWIEKLNSWAFDPGVGCYPGNWDFVALRIGDVNASANYWDLGTPSVAGGMLTSDQERVAQAENLNEEQLLPISSRSNKKYEVSIVASSPLPVDGYQLGIQFDDEILELSKIKPNREYLNATEERNFGQAKKTIRGGTIRTLWVNDFTTDRNGKPMSEEIILFSFEVKSDANAEAIKNGFLFDNGVWENEFYGREGKIRNVELKVIVEEIR